MLLGFFPAHYMHTHTQSHDTHTFWIKDDNHSDDINMFKAFDI